MPQEIHVIDSHTAGEPTRVVIAGGPNLGGGTMVERLAVFRAEHDHFRSAVVNEPRGSDVVVGALICEPVDRSCAAGVLFFNNVGMLGMCGHGLIGVVRTLAHLGKIAQGALRIETPVGVVSATFRADQSVSVVNVPSYRRARGVAIDVDGVGHVMGEVAWGGNWFYLVEEPLLSLATVDLERLIDRVWRIRQAINAAGYPEVDHIELFGPPRSPDANARNFVLCPGKAYDRSPCGTGTSAKLACLAADGKLAPGEPWVQESMIGTQFVGSYQWDDEAAGRVIPTITGTAFITAESRLLLDERDPFCWGLRPPIEE
jgi:4-hydroxyproline epimerase